MDEDNTPEEIAHVEALIEKMNTKEATRIVSGRVSSYEEEESKEESRPRAP